MLAARCIQLPPVCSRSQQARQIPCVQARAVTPAEGALLQGVCLVPRQGLSRPGHRRLLSPISAAAAGSADSSGQGPAQISTQVSHSASSSLPSPPAGSPAPQRSPEPSISSDGPGDGGGSSPGADHGGHDDEHHPGAQMNPFLLVLLSYAAFLAWIGLCSMAMDQYMDTHVHTMSGADKWDVSIIIPVYNDEKILGETLEWLHEHVKGDDKLEIIVVDGGSDDRTIRVAWDNHASRVIRAGRKGRAAQMNAGAAHANNEILVFLAPGTLPPEDLVSVLRSELSDPRTVLLGFKCTVEDSDGEPLRMLTAHHNFKTWLCPLMLRPLEYLTGLRTLFGDQVLCCRKEDFQAVGGYNANLPLMEDADLCKRLHAHGPAPQHLHARHTKLAFKGRIHGRIKEVTDHECVTSGARMDAWSDAYRTYAQFHLTLAWFLGARGGELQRLYDRIYYNHRPTTEAML